MTSEVNELDGKRKTWLSDGSIQLRCAPKLDMVITPDLPNLGHRLDTVDGEYATRVRYRIDGTPIAGGDWGISTDFEGLFVPHSLIPRLVKGHKLVLEYHPEYVTPRTETFDLSGLADAAKAAGCKLR